jgi:hypothetical protein
VFKDIGQRAVGIDKNSAHRHLRFGCSFNPFRK